MSAIAYPCNATGIYYINTHSISQQPIVAEAPRLLSVDQRLRIPSHKALQLGALFFQCYLHSKLLRYETSVDFVSLPRLSQLIAAPLRIGVAGLTHDHVNWILGIPTGVIFKLLGLLKSIKSWQKNIVSNTNSHFPLYFVPLRKC